MFNSLKRANSKKGTWAQALCSLAFSILLLLSMRWLLFEPYVIPSGSMLPSLLVNDHIFVNKLAYGLRWPFSSSWIIKYSNAKRGEIVVFRSVDDPQMFMVKRVIGLPGDKVIVDGAKVSVNGEDFVQKTVSWDQVEGFTKQQLADDSIVLMAEEIDGQSHYVFDSQDFVGEKSEHTVPEGHLFVLGDNRHQSSDSRFWGFLPVENLLGRASLIWFSCEKDSVNALVECGLDEVRYKRLFRSVD